MKQKPSNYKPPKERLETLASVAGRNVVQALVSEIIEQERRIERLEAFCRKLVARPVGERVKE